MQPDDVIIISWFDTESGFKNLKLAYSKVIFMDRQPTYNDQVFYVGWMRGTTLIYIRSLFSLTPRITKAGGGLPICHNFLLIVLVPTLNGLYTCFKEKVIHMFGVSECNDAFMLLPSFK